MVGAALAALAVAAIAGGAAPGRTRRPAPVAMPSMATLLGTAIRAGLRLPADRAADRRLGRAMVWTAIGVVVFGWPGAVVGVVRWAGPAATARRRSDGDRTAVSRELPEAADLLALCLTAGLSVARAIQVVGAVLAGPVGSVLHDLERRHHVGQSLASATSAAAHDVDPEIRPLLALLRSAHVDGGPAAVAFRRLADEGRERRRRQAEERARRAPVLLLFPLVCCILPAFVLLALVPLVGGSFSSLGWS